MGFSKEKSPTKAFLDIPSLRHLATPRTMLKTDATVPRMTDATRKESWMFSSVKVNLSTFKILKYWVMFFIFLHSVNTNGTFNLIRDNGPTLW